MWTDIHGRRHRSQPALLRYRRLLDGTVYATRCLMCGGAWKVYQRRVCDCKTTEIRYERNKS